MKTAAQRADLIKGGANGARLIRLLVDFARADGSLPGNAAAIPADAFAARLGRFFDFSDAITLSGALAAKPFKPAGVPAKRYIDETTPEMLSPSISLHDMHDQLQEDLRMLRQRLEQFILRSFIPANPASRVKYPHIRMELPLDVLAAFDPWRRFLLSHQREMELAVGSMREKLRETLSGVSPDMQVLTRIDAAFDEILQDHARRLLSSLPQHMERRFQYRFAQHQTALDGQEDMPARWTQAGGWIERFSRDVRQVLLAELEFRLQPAQGLLDAFAKEVKTNA